MQRSERAILVADIVESVRLVDLDEEGTIQRWLDLVALAESTIFRELGGRIIKTLGDGFLVDFASVRNAVSSAERLHELVAKANGDLAPERHITLRIGIEFGNVILQSGDVFGQGVNRAARLSSLANPGQTVLSSAVRDKLTESIDGSIEDLGECYVRHQQQPMRAFRIGAPAAGPLLPPGGLDTQLKPVLAVVPLQTSVAVDQGSDRLGDVVSEEIIRVMSRSNDIAVISRLSTAALSARSLTVGEMADHLNADYIMSGSYSVDADTAYLDVELVECGAETVVWAEKFPAKIASLLSHNESPCDMIAKGLYEAITANELSVSRNRPLPTVKSYTLLLSAIELMHHLSPQDYRQSRRYLEELTGRNGRMAVPLAWMANWHVLRVIQGWSDDVARDTSQAIWNSQQALDSDPDCEIALAMDGFANMHLRRRFDVAEDRYDDALRSNPSCAIARLLKGTMYALSDRGEQAVNETERALALSPLDPHRFIYETHCAGAHLSASNFERAEALARKSYRINRRHASTLRILAVALWELDRQDEAREAVTALLRIEPDLTRERYLKRSPNADFKIGKRVADVLNLAGVPA